MKKYLIKKHSLPCGDYYSDTKLLQLASALFVAVIASGSILFTSNSSASDSTSTQVNATVTVGSACTLDVTEDVAHTTKGTPGTTTSDIGLSTLKTVCNDGSGYAIYAVGYSGLEYGNTKMLATISGEPSSTNDIVTGTSTSGNASNWAMKLNAVSGTYAPIIVGSSLDSERQSTTPDFSGYTAVPSTYTRIAYRNSATDTITGSSIQSTYRTYIAGTQPAGTYEGKVKYTLVHPSSEAPLSPQNTQAGKICYYPNGKNVEGTMGCQTISNTTTSATLLASNFSRNGYGFAGWSTTYDYSDPNGFLGPQEDITFNAGQYTGSNKGLSLYAIWIPSTGSLQDSNKVNELCSAGQSGLIAADYNNMGDDDESTWSISANLNSVSALTDNRDNQTYAIAKLVDGNCWMIENLRLADTHQSNGSTSLTILTLDNTNNPLNNGTTVTLKHDSEDTETYNNLAPSSSSWCSSYANGDCINKTMIRTDNTVDRATSPTSNSNQKIYSYGNYYNWYSATAGRGFYNIGLNYTVSGDICPHGWHLPTGTGTGDFGQLSNGLGGYRNGNSAQEMNESSTPSSATMLKRFKSFPNNFILAGYAYQNSIYYRGSGGNYQSSTSSSSSYWGNAYLYLGSKYIFPGTGTSGMYYGDSIRCKASLP